MVKFILGREGYFDVSEDLDRRISRYDYDITNCTYQELSFWKVDTAVYRQLGDQVLEVLIFEHSKVELTS